MRSKSKQQTSLFVSELICAKHVCLVMTQTIARKMTNVCNAIKTTLSNEDMHGMVRYGSQESSPGCFHFPNQTQINTWNISTKLSFNVYGAWSVIRYVCIFNCLSSSIWNLVNENTSKFKPISCCVLAQHFSYSAIRKINNFIIVTNGFYASQLL